MADLVNEGKLNIRVDEEFYGKQVVLDFQDGETGRHTKEIEGTNKIDDELTPLIKKVDDVKEDYDNLDRGWHIGKIAERNVRGEDISNGDFAVLTDLGYSKDGTYVGQMRNVHRIFPNQEYADEHIKASYLGELTQLQDISDEKVREINDNVRDLGLKIRKKHVRAIRGIWNCESMEEAIKNIIDRAEFDDSTPNEIQDIIEESYKILGRNVNSSRIEDITIENY